MPEIPAVLLVDPDEETAQVLETVFCTQGYLVTRAATAVKAFSILRANAISLMILDLHLPDTDGFVFLSMVRRSKPALAVVITTQDQTVESLLKAMRMGARGYLIKPLAPEQVLECVKAILLETRPRRRARGAVRSIRELLPH
jgi:DNA-binding response OmpR family regulator